MAEASCSATMPSTRIKTAVWLIGQPREKLPVTVLPTVGDMLKTFFYNHKMMKRTVSDSLKATCNELVEIWEKSRIPTAFKPNIISKMRTEVDEYNLVKKNKGRVSDAQKSRELQFVNHMKELFDIAHKEAEQLIRINEDRLFLKDQRGHRKMTMAGEDKTLTAKEKRSRQRRQQELARKDREVMRNTLISGASGVSCTSTLSDSDVVDSSSSDSDEAKNSDYEVEIPLYYRQQLSTASSRCPDGEPNSKKPQLLQKALMSPDVASALDRINLSDTKFTILAAAISKANDEDVGRVPLSRSTVYRRRKTHRESVEAQIHQEFKTSSRPPLVLHWDGKLMQDTTDRCSPAIANVDRLAVCVTGYGVEKILGIVKIQSGTGNAQANASFQLLHLWEVTDEVVGMCFDTTASNTGPNSGACVLLEQIIGKNLLYLACRHHVHEVVIGGLFSTLFGPSNSPKIPLFERFQHYWSNIENGTYRPFNKTILSNPFAQLLKNEVVTFTQNFLSTTDAYMPRDDYREIAELCLLILGAPPLSGSYHFRAPGAYHRARWMAKVIYCFKIYLFMEHFKLTTKEQRSLTDFCLFASLVYVKAWLSCPIASDAPINDLLLFKQIQQYSTVNKAVSECVMHKFKRHLWYLGPELIPLSLFSTKMSVMEKREMVEAMKHCQHESNRRCIKLESTDDVQNKELWELVNSSSTSSLRALHVDVDFLFNNDPDTWMDSLSFQHSRAIINSLKVVNDAAERSISLMSAFNESLTKTEVEMQRLIQVVEDHRKRVPDSRKRTLMDYVARRK